MGTAVRVGMLVLLVLGARGLAAPPEEPPAATLADTVRWDPHGKAAGLALSMLSRRGHDGFRALGALARELEREDLDAALRVAHVLAAGGEAPRREVAKAAYLKTKNERIRAALALCLARGYPENAAMLHLRLREGIPGAEGLLRALAEHGLPMEELERALSVKSLAPVAHEILRARGESPATERLLPLAREAAPRGLHPDDCRAFAEEFAEAPYFPLLAALARLLEGTDEDARVGAHCLLQAASGLDLPPDRLMWESWVEAKRETYEPPEDLSPGMIGAAVARAVRYLRRDLLPDARCTYTKNKQDSAVGATALALLALKAADVPRDDAAFEKALAETLLVFGRDGTPGLPAIARRYETYSLALLAMALEALDAEKYRGPLEAVAGRLARGILVNGQWTYGCLSDTEPNRPKHGDNSNTQYGALGLRALRKAGVEVPRTVWERAAANWLGTVKSAGWGYRTDGKHRRFSMTAAGIGSLAICMEGIHGNKAGERIRAEPVVCDALEYLGKMLMTYGYKGQNTYAFYGVERACRLTGTERFRSLNRSFDWYRRGAGMLLRGQETNGSWGGARTKKAGIHPDYGAPVDTAFAILFLEKATITVPGMRGLEVVTVLLTDELDVPEPKPEEGRPEPPAPPPPPAGPVLELDATHLRTSTGEVVVRGTLGTPGAAVTVDGRTVDVDDAGRFSATLTIEGARDIEVVARSPDGTETRKRVDAVLDEEPPVLELVGSRIRHVGKQRIELRANEPLESLRAAGHYFPADGRTAEATVVLTHGMRNLHVTATDLAGNRTRGTFKLDVVNRVLVLDGKSAVRVDVRERPSVFTLECWARGSNPGGRSQSVVGNIEGSGFGLMWSVKGKPHPQAYVRVKSGWLEPRAKHPWKWSSWTHLAVTYDGRAARLFVNGKLHDTVAGAPHVKSSRAFYVGAEPDGKNRPANRFDGYIDEVRVSDVVRYTESFRPAKYFMEDRHTLLLLHFDTDTEKAYLDMSGRHRHGKPYGKPMLGEERR